MGCGASTSASEIDAGPIIQNAHAKGHAPKCNQGTTQAATQDCIKAVQATDNPAVQLPGNLSAAAGPHAAVAAASDEMASVAGSDEVLPIDVDSQEINELADIALSTITTKLQQLTTAADKVNPQDLKPPILSKAEKGLLKYSWLGKAIVDGGGALMESLPFGSTVATLLSALYNTTVRCAKNKQNCRQLVQQIQRCDMQIANAVKARGTKTRWPAGTLQALRDLTNVIEKAAGIIKKYSDHGCIMLFITSQGYQHEFQRQYKDESQDLREAICSAAGGESDIQKAIQQLRTQQHGKLRELLAKKGGFTYQIIDDELRGLEAKVDAIETRLSVLEKRGQQQQNKAPESLSAYLGSWWADVIGQFERSACWQDVREALLRTATSVIQKCGMKLHKEAQDQGWPLPADKDPSAVFLDHVVLMMLDQDKDSVITLSELNSWQEYTRTWVAKFPPMMPPTSVAQLLECTLYCCDRKLLKNSLLPADSLTDIEAKLKVHELIRSYNLAVLLDDYLTGTRTWIMDKIMNWFQAARAPESETSRMFLLLADAGMGKSVCSAVLLKHLTALRADQPNIITAHHFFKVGQSRGEGTAMVKCLVQQLCEQVPEFAAIIERTLTELPNLDSLSLAEVFDKLMLGPLRELDQQLQDKPSCLLLLDALDESDDNNKGWEPVCNLVAAQFKYLPSWICVLVTGRPHVQQRFGSWDPAVWIAAKENNNKKDLYELLLAKLKHKQLVAENQLSAAAQLLLDKSQGQFIYSKYVFLQLEEQPHWTLEQLQQLPDGLQQVYCYQLDTIEAALKADRPELVVLFKDRLLPILAVMKEALTTQLLTWLVQGQQQDVELFVRVLYSLFPSRTSPDGTITVAPYHKSIQDFLLLEDQQGAYTATAAQRHWKTPANEAHGLFVTRFLPELQGIVMQHWRDKCGSQLLPHLPVGQQYCLQHLIDHIAASKDWAALHALTRHIPALKAVLEVPGQVYKMIRVLGAAANSNAGNKELLSIQRFLKATCHIIDEDVDDILQVIACCPRDCVLGDWSKVLHSHFSGLSQFWEGSVRVTRAEHFPPEVQH